MKNKIILLLACLAFSGCGYRFAIIKENICNHPESVREAWGWALAPRINPLHWHYGIHSKCERCGQKFCEYWKRDKLLNRIK